ncbi:MAG TPA: amino acid aminotransferase [Caldimonas sp.]|jgi:aromatic-amino-acid transaminase|nr:amino acid aminotransferase [Caldimonas sp.]HEX2540470.1 amino acid aminotransferase [Caldimonas sp.]
MSSLFDAVEMAPRDPILGISEQFAADPNPNKVNLSVGVYYDENGKLPLLQCVRKAEALMMETPKARGYLPIDGIASYDDATQALVFGADHPVRRAGRIATVQAVGGTGGLKLGADLLRRMSPGSQVLISDPSWENHRALFEGAGFAVHSYPYYDAKAHAVDFPAMLAYLKSAAPGSIAVLHACCHNPTGCDLTSEQWSQVVSTLVERRLVPFLDLAYQGFGEGIFEDGVAVRLCLDAGLDFFVATSFSKSFSLYGERVGALSVVCASQDAAARVLSQLKRVIRTNYSNPPTHGAAAVAHVLTTPELRTLWEQELAGMRERIKRMRFELQRRLVAAGAPIDTDFITVQRGMFSYSGLNKTQMQRLRSEFGIYGVDSGRICVAALNDRNIGAVVDAIVQVTERATA